MHSCGAFYFICQIPSLLLMLQDHVLHLLADYQTDDPAEKTFRAQIIDFVARFPADFHVRTNNAGHLTASGWVLNPPGTHALLLHHAKLDRWLQPGGHIESGDATLLAASLREVLEETGLNQALPAATGLFDLDVHAIPARGLENAHLHFDCRFLFRSQENAVVTASSESRGFAWVALDQLLEPAIPASLRRMARKSLSSQNQ